MRIAASFVFCLLVGIDSARPLRAESAADLFANIGPTTIAQTVDWVRGEPTTPVPESVRRLVWHVGRLTPSTLEARAIAVDQVADEARFDVVAMDGVATRAETFRIEGEAAEFLDMDRLWIVEVQTVEAAAPLLLLCRDAPLQWLAGQTLAGPLNEPVRFTAIVLDASAPPVALAQRVEWYPGAAHPETVASPAERLLGGAGFDVGRLPEIQRRASLPLEDEPAHVFYGLFGALASTDPAAFDPVAEQVRPIELLSGDDAQAGAIVRTPVETRRVTRVAVTDPTARELLGQDYYWQIDAFGDLDRTKVQLETGTGELVEFENRYPISILAAELSEELRGAVVSASGGRADVVMVNRPIRVTGAMYRLWSYESDFVGARGGGRQVAPLVIAAQISDIEQGGLAQANLQRLGIVVAAIVIVSIVAIAALLFWTSRRDHAVARKVRRAQVDPDLSRLGE